MRRRYVHAHRDAKALRARPSRCEGATCTPIAMRRRYVHAHRDAKALRARLLRCEGATCTPITMRRRYVHAYCDAKALRARPSRCEGATCTPIAAARRIHDAANRCCITLRLRISGAAIRCGEQRLYRSLRDAQQKMTTLLDGERCSTHVSRRRIVLDVRSADRNGPRCGRFTSAPRTHFVRRADPSRPKVGPGRPFHGPARPICGPAARRHTRPTVR